MSKVSKPKSATDCCQMVKAQIKGDLENNRLEIAWSKKHGQTYGDHTEWIKALTNIRKYVVAHQKVHDKEAFMQFLMTERDRSKYGSGEWKAYNEYLGMAMRF